MANLRALTTWDHSRARVTCQSCADKVGTWRDVWGGILGCFQNTWLRNPTALCASGVLNSDFQLILSRLGSKPQIMLILERKLSMVLSYKDILLEYLHFFIVFLTLIILLVWKVRLFLVYSQNFKKINSVSKGCSCFFLIKYHTLCACIPCILSLNGWRILCWFYLEIKEIFFFLLM